MSRLRKHECVRAQDPKYPMLFLLIGTSSFLTPTLSGMCFLSPNPSFGYQPGFRSLFLHSHGSYLRDEPSLSLVERQSILRGYELYVVEQWACSRQSPTLVVATCTGDETHTITVDIIAIPNDESAWPARLQFYFKHARHYHARSKETGLGEILVTNLSSFPSALTVIPIPDGDVGKHRLLFIVNEDLRRLGCSGRSSLTLSEPSETTQAKFRQLYRTSDRIPFSESVMELVQLCQIALHFFRQLDREYIDGLLCDMTETAIADWWTEVGAEHYNFEPTDGILGPSTVAALLGLFMGARNRLHWYGAPVAKDAFDMESTKRGLAFFQKQQKLAKTRRLDCQTLFRLHNATAKAAAGEGWGVQKAVKSRMTEMGGKRREIVLDMVSGKDRGGLADIETLDMDRFVVMVYGERPRWLWRAKPRRTPVEGSADDDDMNNLALARKEASGRNSGLASDDGSDKRPKEELLLGLTHASGPNTSLVDCPGEKDARRKAVFRTVAGKMSDARSGLGRIRDAVGGARRGQHISRPSYSAKQDFVAGADVSGDSPWNAQPSAAAPGGPGMRRADEELVSSEPESLVDEIGMDIRKELLPKASPAMRPMEEDGGPELLSVERRSDSRRLAMLIRRHSFGAAGFPGHGTLNENRWPRRLSFGAAEEAVLTWEDVAGVSGTFSDVQFVSEPSHDAGHVDRFDHSIAGDLRAWVEGKVKAVGSLDERNARDVEELQKLYQQLEDSCQHMEQQSNAFLVDERSQLGTDIKEVDVYVARLEYELGGLVQKVHDVEDGIEEFERQVVDVEQRAQDLREQLENEGWLHWFVRTLTGVGTGPNITSSTS